MIKMRMDFADGIKYERKILESIEKELGRKISKDEKKIFRKACRKGLNHGYMHGLGGIN
jgi:hypothetical protein